MKRDNWPSFQELDAAAIEIAHAALMDGVGIVAIGGYAMLYHGSDRLTLDVDFAATGDIPSLPHLKRSRRGFHTLATNGVHGDIVLRDDLLHYQAIETAIYVNYYNIGGPLPVARKEYLAAMKFLRHRLRDLRDVTWLVTQGRVDPSRVMEILSNTAMGLASGARAADRFNHYAAEALAADARDRTKHG